eukprot:Pompholyxophrys_punicea_v1_NODE_56_length_4190_cov_12.775333.p6 type:complete len:101 gc:universal NODE_56_length_4190_cov_12.775333:1789-1487(-)
MAGFCADPGSIRPQCPLLVKKTPVHRVEAEGVAGEQHLRESLEHPHIPILLAVQQYLLVFHIFRSRIFRDVDAPDQINDQQRNLLYELALFNENLCGFQL